MALTLLELKKRYDTTIREADYIDYYAESSILLQYVDFRNIEGNAYKYNRVDRLPGVAFRGINEGYPESTGVLASETESLSTAGGDIDVDRILIDSAGQDPNAQNAVRTQEEQLKVESLALFLSKKFIKGDSSFDPREFDGLQKRIVGTQLVNANPTATTSGGDALDIFAIEQALSKIRQGGRTVMMMNSQMKLRLAAYARKANSGVVIQPLQTDFGGQVDGYNQIPIIQVDDDNDGNPILGFDEANPGGGTPASTSIYIVSFGPGRVQMLQGRTNGKHGISVKDLGELQAKPTWRTRVEWDLGLMIQHAKSVARIQGIKDAQITNNF